MYFTFEASILRLRGGRIPPSAPPSHWLGHGVSGTQ